MSPIPSPPPPDRAAPLPLLRSFALAAQSLSFKVAAAQLHVTPAAVSQQIKALETLLGTPLFHRLTRALALTEAGAALLPPVLQGLALLDGAVAAARRDSALRAADRPRQRLWLSAPPSLASHWLLPRLPAFEAAHPGCTVGLSASPETVGPAGVPPWQRTAADGRPEPAAEAGADDCALAILYGPADTLGAGVLPLLRPDYLPVCTPALAAQLRQPADLARQVLIVDDALASAGRRGRPWGWPQWLRAAGVRLPKDQPVRRLSNAVLAIEAALAGQGVALVAREWVVPALEAGTLVAPLPLSLPSPYTYGLACHPALADQPLVQALRDWLLAQAAPAPGA